MECRCDSFGPARICTPVQKAARRQLIRIMKIVELRLPGQNLPMTLVEALTDTGLVGVGGCEAQVAAIRPIIEGYPWRLGDLVKGRDPRDVGRLWTEMVHAIGWQSGLVLHAAAALD